MTSIKERAYKSLKMIGTMCSEGRPPLMTIPARYDDEYNEDLYISGTIRCLLEENMKLHQEIEKLKEDNGPK